MADGCKPGKLWLAIPADSACWEYQMSSAGFVQLFARENEAPLGAFAFDYPSDFSSRFSALVAEIGKGAAGLRAKLVVSRGISAPVRAALVGLKVEIVKVVERDAPFELRFHSKERKIFVSQEQAAQAAPEKIELVKPRKIRALIVDDSPTVRKLLERILSGDPEVEVVGTVGLPSELEGAIELLHPDVITLDIHLPEMNGVDLLQQFLPKHRIPTVMISSISMEEGPLVLRALEIGAVDYIQKPSFEEIAALSPLIVAKVKAAAGASVRVGRGQGAPVARRITQTWDISRTIVIGSSTGGTEALKEIFVRLPEGIPPIVVVQHIPAVFSRALAERLNGLCPFEVVEGRDGMDVQPGRVIIAPGGLQMSLRRWGSGLQVQVQDTEPVNRHKPSVDVLMDSAAKVCGAQAIGIILTGMGADGAKGLLNMKNAGAFTIGQDEKSCVVYGMPQAAFKLGATTEVISLLKIPERLGDLLVHKARAS